MKQFKVVTESKGGVRGRQVHDGENLAVEEGHLIVEGEGSDVSAVYAPGYWSSAQLATDEEQTAS